MKIEPIAATRINPTLTPSVLSAYGDLSTLFWGKGTEAEAIIEFAGRVCYRSTHRMGTAKDFISARVREGHVDIIEHVVVTVRVRNSNAPSTWRLLNRHCEVTQIFDGEWIVSANARVWLDLFRHGEALDALPILKGVVPAVFSEFEGTGSVQISVSGHPAISLPPVQSGPLRVTLIGYTQPLCSDLTPIADPTVQINHGAATFFFEGISRACTHQLVRHRLASFSQESQRYVELNKGGWKAIVPPSIAENEVALAELNEFWRIAEEKYNRLRELGIRKEDARFLLPNAAETRIVATMNFAAWSHFLWLRALDKAAQWEIRTLGQKVLEMLYVIAPEVFNSHWCIYQERFLSKT